MVLAAANAYTGGTLINAGTLRLAGSGTLGAATDQRRSRAGSSILAGPPRRRMEVSS
ncbi:autotransporter-associated beta strand repeat-containing protein [Bradyrhizobium sp. ORS 285]|uniref:autotransporter-associated beta strand repeat-containing protein n=1 Tax=Bradyrhizobium sp. ORS 285 TaxID=115808 RepID=UPI000A0636C7